MAVDPKPITLTQVNEGDYDGVEPAPFVVVGELPVPSGDVKTLTAVPASFADLAAVRSYLNTLVTQLKSSDLFD